MRVMRANNCYVRLQIVISVGLRTVRNVLKDILTGVLDTLGHRFLSA
jgi:hypothetical protein